jgi:hypothetical protein
MFALIKGEDEETPNWNKNFVTDRYEIVMVDDPGVSELTKFEIGLLNDICREFQDKDDLEVGDYTHDYPEFIRHKPDGVTKKVENIPFEEIVNEVRPNDAAAIERDAKQIAVFDRVFGR